MVQRYSSKMSYNQWRNKRFEPGGQSLAEGGPSVTEGGPLAKRRKKS